ncbi:diguanylate cyclase [Halomonas sp. wenzhen-202101]|uniref:Diguanylate cyclase n=2 Tax=Halomonas dongshanensis TaxID=2890835 RepID=A0ABT2ECS8_9GAMM|nr:diguanylate cyclase [Halomonas dongshanensis]MCS2609168.1 diguanylate cyclase [Halomonas dongshanensis]
MGLAIIWLLVVTLVVGAAWHLGKEMMLKTNITHLRYESTLLADEVTQQINSRIRSLERVSTKLGEEENPTRLYEELRSNQALLSWFEGLVAIDQYGRVVADMPGVAGRMGLDTAEREFFGMVKGTLRPYVSEPFIGRASQEPIVVIVAPRIAADGAFLGAIGGVMNLTGGIFERLSRVRLGEHGYASIATASGKILYHPNRDLLLTQTPIQPTSDLLDQALYGWQGEGVGPLQSGQAGLQSYAQVWPANWIVCLFIPLSQTELLLSDFIGQLLWLWGLLALSMLPLLWWLLRKQLRPFSQLAQQIKEVGLRQRRRVALTTSMQELQNLTETFNRVEEERDALLAHLQEREAFLDSVLNTSPQGMFVASFDGQITYINPALLEMLGFDRNVSQPSWLKQIHRDDLEDAKDLWLHSLKSGNDFIRQLRFIREDGEVLWLDIHARSVMLYQGGHSLGLVGVVKDITERRAQEALQRWEAEHDPLTGLLNRRGFLRRLEEAFADFQKTSTPSALLLFDLDRFKPINDEGGHALGDEMLRRIAQVVAWEVRRSDHVARQGGDEFAVLLPSCTLGQAERIAEALRQAVSEISVSQAGREYHVTLSIGVTTFDEHDASVEEALERADAGSYYAKDRGRNGVVVNIMSDEATQLFE